MWWLSLEFDSLEGCWPTSKINKQITKQTNVGLSAWQVETTASERVEGREFHCNSTAAMSASSSASASATHPRGWMKLVALVVNYRGVRGWLIQDALYPESAASVIFQTITLVPLDSQAGHKVSIPELYCSSQCFCIFKACFGLGLQGGEGLKSGNWHSAKAPPPMHLSLNPHCSPIFWKRNWEGGSIPFPIESVHLPPPFLWIWLQITDVWRNWAKIQWVKIVQDHTKFEIVLFGRDCIYIMWKSKIILERCWWPVLVV